MTAPSDGTNSVGSSPEAYDPKHLTLFATRVLQQYNVPTDDAELVADSLVVAERWGHASHGLLRLPWYAARLRTGAMRHETVITIDQDRGAVLAIDGHDGIGQVIADKAITLATERAATHGVGVVGVKNSNHFGTAAYFTRKAASKGFAAILTTNGSPAMAPWGGMDKIIGANPWSFAAPDGFGDVAEVDIANTGVARGKIYAAQERGEDLPSGWALDREGVPTTSAAAALDGGIVLPMAGHKGYAISFMMDVFSGVLTGSGFGTHVHGPYEPEERSRSGHLAIVIDLRSFGAPELFEERMRELIGQVRSVRTMPGVGRVYYPGEVENERMRAEAAVALPSATVDGLVELGNEVGVRLPEAL